MEQKKILKEERKTIIEKKNNLRKTINTERDYYCTFEQVEAYWVEHMTEPTTTTPPPTTPFTVSETKWQQQSSEDLSNSLLQGLLKQQQSSPLDRSSDRCDMDRWMSHHCMMAEEEQEQEEEEREPRGVRRGGKPKIICGGDIVCPVGRVAAAANAAAVAI